MESVISIIVPIYKVEKYLRQCLDSVVNQTYRNLEIILIDDGSPDRCGEVCDEYAAKDPRVRVIHKPNEGLSAARNDALEITTGDWILFVDSDDWLEPNLCEEALCTAQAEDVDILMYDLIKEDPNIGSRRVYAFPESFVSDDCALVFGMQLSALNRYYSPISTAWSQGFPWDKLFRSELILKNGLRFATNVKANEDVIFALHAFQFANRIGYIPKPFYHYRMNQASIGHKFTPDRVEIDLEIYREMKRIGELYGLKEDYYRALDARIVDNTCLCANRCFFDENGNKSLLEELKYVSHVLKIEPIYSAFERVDRKKMGLRNKVITLSRHHNAILLYLYHVLHRLKDNLNEKLGFANRGGV